MAAVVTNICDFSYIYAAAERHCCWMRILEAIIIIGRET